MWKVHVVSLQVLPLAQHFPSAKGVANQLEKAIGRSGWKKWEDGATIRVRQEMQEPLRVPEGGTWVGPL